jgi:hypothetical protein
MFYEITQAQKEQTPHDFIYGWNLGKLITEKLRV